MIDQLFGAPACHGLLRAEGRGCQPGGTGFQAQASAPVRASKARTMPGAASTSRLSATKPLITTRSRITSGGEVGCTAQARGSSRSRRRSTRPSVPKSPQGLPVSASSAISFESEVP